MMIAHTKPLATPVQEISSAEAWAMLEENAHAQLIDVRSNAEWLFVGTPDLSRVNRKPILLEWKRYPGFSVNADFSAELTKQITDVNTPLLFLCRSGGRSMDAAMTMKDAGYSQCYNITDGFEGEPDANGKRGHAGGWKAAGLPWMQG